MAKRIGECTSDKELVEAVEAARERRLALRRGHEKTWYENLALLSGDHYAEYDATRGRYYEQPNEDGRVRIVLNHALTVSRTELAKLTRQRPIMEVIPSSDDAEDLAAARTGRSVLDESWMKHALRSKRKQALWWALNTGLGAIYVGWDPYNNEDGYHEFVIDPQTNEAIFDVDRQKELQQLDKEGVIKLKVEQYALGDVDIKVFSPFQLLPDETKLDFNEICDLITTEVVDIDVAKDVWGKNARDVHPDRGQLGTGERRVLERAGVKNLQAGQVEHGLQVHTFWLKPNHYGSEYLRSGKMIRWCNKQKILEVSDFPFNDGRIPFSFFQHIPSNLSIWPESTLQHIREANLEMDKTASMILEARNYMANPIWRVATQHKIKGKIKNVAGAIVRYRHMPNVPPPDRVEGTSLPASVENIMPALRAEILEISGQGETSRGNVPSGVRSGVAVAYLQEEDDTRLGPTAEDFEDALALTGSLILSRCGQYYTTERLVRLHKKEDQTWDVLRFKGADLKGQTDVQCQTGSSLPRHKAAKQQYVLDLVQMGILQDPKRIEEMLELGEAEPDALDLAKSQAARENNLMLRGIQMKMIDPEKVFAQAAPAPQAPPGVAAEPSMDGMIPPDQEQAAPPGPPAQELSVAVPVKRWHMHDVHLDSHYRLMMSEEYERMTAEDPQLGAMIVRLFDEHVTLHEQEKARIMQEQMMMQMAAQAQGSGQNGQSPDVMSSGPDLAAQAQQSA